MFQSIPVNNSTILEDTISMLNELDFSELEAVQSFIRTIETKDDYYKPQSEAELLERINKAIAQVDAGLAIDAEEAENAIRAEFGL